MKEIKEFRGYFKRKYIMLTNYNNLFKIILNHIKKKFKDLNAL